MVVTAAKSAGFCFGVARAVRMAEELAAAPGRSGMLGHIIHNDHEIARLASLGLTVLHTPEEAEPGDRVPVYLDPGLTCGTGAHATTRLSLTALEERIHCGERVLDLG